jgi:hypothetical protein
MIIEPINPQSILKTAAMRFKMIVAEADQEVTLKLSPSAEAEGFIIVWQPALPSIR